MGNQVINADGRGAFAATVLVTVVAPNSPYLVTVTAIHPNWGAGRNNSP